MGHSIIPPSSAAIWGAPGGCTGWVLMNQMYPQTEQSEESAEGEAAHQIGAEQIERARVGAPFWSWAGYDGRAADNGVIFDEAMFEGATMYAENVAAEMKGRGVFASDAVRIEQRLAIPAVHAESFGTPDCSLWDATIGELIIWDFKYGYGVVEAFENWQMLNYFAGLFDLIGVPDEYVRVRFRVAQPRAWHREGSIREWVVMASDLRGYVNQLNYNAHKALSNDAEFHTGPHCKHCPGRHACPAALKAGLQLFEAAVQPVPVELDPVALGTQLHLIKRARAQLEYLETGYSEQIAALIRQGRDVPGWDHEPTFGRKKWNRPAAEVAQIGDLMGVDLRKPVDVVTPGEAKKRGIDESVINAYSETPRTGFKVVPDNGNKAKQVFSK